MSDRAFVFYIWLGYFFLSSSIVGDATGGNSIEVWTLILGFLGIMIVWYRVEKAISVAQSESNSALTASYEQKIEALQSELDKKIEALKRFQAKQSPSDRQREAKR